jgi:uncharacterized protein YdhG (YjbR/CyaY superfamily)
MASKRANAKGPSATGTKQRAVVKRTPIATVDEYLARVPEPARTTLEKLRKAIEAAAPQATELISYQVPAFRQAGMLVSFGATKKHCSFYVMSGTLLASFKRELAAYDTSKGTIRFAVDTPLPAALVKKIVKARLADNEARDELKKKLRAKVKVAKAKR